eukprot:TRINITY_DN54516_c0_g1_i1.p1 TRINITY_DN54516_c0_g1~~TRINITY_DN54516_c0_g1_i1.p1  ORF type:complete len:402 (-),score=67.23 TRINITY_DN54516_c0_g1_i1:90-1295(-)
MIPRFSSPFAVLRGSGSTPPVSPPSGTPTSLEAKLSVSPTSLACGNPPANGNSHQKLLRRSPYRFLRRGFAKPAGETLHVDPSQKTETPPRQELPRATSVASKPCVPTPLRVKQSEHIATITTVFTDAAQQADGKAMHAEEEEQGENGLVRRSDSAADISCPLPLQMQSESLAQEVNSDGSPMKIESSMGKVDTSGVDTANRALKKSLYRARRRLGKDGTPGIDDANRVLKKSLFTARQRLDNDGVVGTSPTATRAQGAVVGKSIVAEDGGSGVAVSTMPGKGQAAKIASRKTAMHRSTTAPVAPQICVSSTQQQVSSPTVGVALQGRRAYSTRKRRVKDASAVIADVPSSPAAASPSAPPIFIAEGDPFLLHDGSEVGDASATGFFPEATWPWLSFGGDG